MFTFKCYLLPPSLERFKAIYHECYHFAAPFGSASPFRSVAWGDSPPPLHPVGYWIHSHTYTHAHRYTVYSLGLRHSRVVTFAAIRLRGSGFKPRPGQKFETTFLLYSFS